MKKRAVVRRATLSAGLAACALAMAAGPVSATPPAIDSWDGRCSVSGSLAFEDAFGGEPTFTEWREEGAGVCSGLLNGVPVTDTPITVRGSGSGTVSCLVGGTDMRMTNTVTFTRGTRGRGDDASIAVSGQSMTVLGESVALMRGDVSGETLAHVDFFVTSGFDTADKCSTNSVRSMSFRATTQTLSTMKG